MTVWEPVIGLEVHVQLATRSKAFSASAVEFGAPPNTLVDPTVLGLPGALPTFNARALELALRLGVAVGSTIRTTSRFARKHYFYPDQPKGYQISQFDEPLCERGTVAVISSAPGAGHVAQVALTRIHLEEDAGKSMHAGAVSHIDLDRAGMPLVEVVTEPVIGSADHAADFMRSLHRLVRWLEVSEADMEKGQLRCDANVSIRPRGAAELGTRTELKNINSFRFVHAAIEHEIARQVRIVEAGGRVERETRLWDAELGRSASMRSKEESNDYRYFPDPDLPPLVVAARVGRRRSRRLARAARRRGSPATSASSVSRPTTRARWSASARSRTTTTPDAPRWAAPLRAAARCWRAGCSSSSSVPCMPAAAQLGESQISREGARRPGRPHRRRYAQRQARQGSLCRGLRER